MVEKQTGVDIPQLISFVFPPNLQHPLAAARLYAFGECGPLDLNGNLRSGFRGCHVVMDYELDEMCIQYEREDLIKIYLHNPSDFGLLSSKEEESIIGQADGHLKRAKGRAMLPQLTREEAIGLFEDLPRNSEGICSFHDVQRAIMNFRAERIKKYKLVYPNLCSNKPRKQLGAKAETEAERKHSRNFMVSENVAPKTMFLKNAGQTNSDVIEQTTKYLSKHAFKINDPANSAASVDMVSNIRLLRDLNGERTATVRRRQFEADLEEDPQWNSTCSVKGTGFGSGVKSMASSSTWKRNSTLY